MVQDLGLKDWVIKYSDGKADPALVERWINIPRGTGMIHFHHRDLLKRDGVSTFMCQGSALMARSVTGRRRFRHEHCCAGKSQSAEVFQVVTAWREARPAN
jgi:hypothetical protein